MKKVLSVGLFALLALVGIAHSRPLYAQSVTDLFNPHLIISDEEMQDYHSWTEKDIQNFLDTKGSYLRQYETADANGQIKPAARIISEAAETYHINPKFILVTLQKEQSLVTSANPSNRQLDWATGYAVCDSCNLDDPNVIKHKGFGNQVDGAAGLIRWYYNNQDQSFVKKKDAQITISNQTVIPQSWATAFLYTYTPHLHGNQNFYYIWQDWFGQHFPDGTLFKTVDNNYWLLDQGKRRHFKTMAALISRFDPKIAVPVADDELNNYEVGVEINFSNFSLLNDGTNTFLLDNDTLRPFASAEVVKKLGYNPDEIISVHPVDLQNFATGTPITLESIAPEGIIYRVAQGKEVTYFLFKDNQLSPFLHPSIALLRSKQLTIEDHTLAEIKKIPFSKKIISFADGVLLQNETSRYVVEKGKRRPIPDETTFAQLGYNEENLITVDSLTLLALPEGEVIHGIHRSASSTELWSSNITASSTDVYVTSSVTSDLPAFLIAEYPSGKIIAGKNIDQPRPMASLTKIITAFEALTQKPTLLSGTTIYNSKKHAAYGNYLQLVNGEKIKNVDLLNTSLIGSINNVTRMLAQASSLSEDKLIQKMNTRLKSWGATSTVIYEVTGLDARNHTTPRDMLHIFTKVLTNPTIKSALGKNEYQFKEITNKNKISSHLLTNTNHLFATKSEFYSVVASKTGYLDEAGACLVQLVKSKKNGKLYTIVTMGDPDYPNRFDEPNRLAEAAASGITTFKPTTP